MAFDAGAIEARLTVDPAAFDRGMDKAEGRVKRFEDAGHKVKISAVFDQSSMTRARKMFGDLDNAISKDAMSRLRSSPQGSVLGALNALFSPHPVSGAPSPAQAASQGLLGKMITAPGGGGPPGASVIDNRTNPLASALQNVDTTNNIRQNLTGTGASDTTTTDSIRQALIGQGAQDTTTTDSIRQALIGTGAQDVTTTDTIRQALAGQGAQDTTTTDKIMQQLVGTGPGNTATTDTIREKLDPKSTRDVEKAAEDSGGRASSRWTIGFGSHLGPFFSSFHKTLGDAGSSGGMSLGKGLLAGMGPGILGISAKMSGIVGGVGTLLGTLPALSGVAGVGVGVALIGGITAKLAADNPQIKAAFTSLFGGKNAAGKAVTGSLSGVFDKAFAPMVPAITSVLRQVTGLVKQMVPALTSIFKTIAPQIEGIFAGIKPVITGLLSVMQAAAPAFGPFINAITGLVANLLPGLATIIRATVPFISQFAGILSGLGRNLGGLFAAAAPAIKASMQLLGTLLGVVGGLLPVVMQLADIFATALAPVFTQVAGVITALEPVLLAVGKVIASLAGAILGDLVAAFGAFATLVKAAAPGLKILAGALGQVFTVLENTGVFAILGDALENMAAPLGSLITALAKGLAPILPPVIKFISQMAALIASTLSGAIIALLPPLTTLATTVLASLATILPVVVPLLTTMAGIFSTAVVAVIGALASALNAVISAIPLPVITGLILAFTAYRAAILSIAAVQAVIAILAGLGSAFETMQIAYLIFTQDMVGATVKIIASAVAQAAAWVASAATSVGAFIAMAAAATAAYIAENLATLGIIAGITALVAGIIYLATHWTQVWGEVKAIAADAWNFIYNGFGKYLLPLLGPVGLIALGAIELSQHWTQIWGVIGTTVDTALKAIEAVAKVAWDQIAAYAKVSWDALAGILKAVWAVISGAFKLFIALLTGNWTAAGNAIRTAGTQAWNAIKMALGQIWNAIAGLAAQTWKQMGGAATAAWDAMKNAAETIWGTIVGFFKGVPGAVIGAMKSLGGDLRAFGSNVMTDMFDGIKAIWNDIIGFFGGLAKDILHALGIHSPPDWAIAAGKFIVQGIGIGMAQAQSAATKAAKLVAGGAYTTLKGSVGANQALGKQMAAARGWVGPLWNDLNAVEMDEAGWNPNAKNPTSNAYGIAQFINGPSEYAQWGGNASTVAGQITGMYNYIASRYGNPAAALLHEQAFHWYGLGGTINEPVLGYGLNTGDRYMLGESGREVVTPVGRGGSDGSAAVIGRLDQLIAVTRQIPAGVGGSVGGAIGGASQSASFRSRYPRGGG